MTVPSSGSGELTVAKFSMQRLCGRLCGRLGQAAKPDGAVPAQDLSVAWVKGPEFNP